MNKKRIKSKVKIYPCPYCGGKPKIEHAIYLYHISTFLICPCGTLQVEGRDIDSDNSDRKAMAFWNAHCKEVQ